MCIIYSCQNKLFPVSHVDLILYDFFFFSIHTSHAMNSLQMGCSSSDSFGCHRMCFSGWSGWHFNWTQAPFSLVSPFCFSLVIFFHMFQEAISTLRVLNMLDMNINSFSKNPAPYLFVYNNANSMLGHTVNSSSVAMVNIRKWPSPGCLHGLSCKWWIVSFHPSSLERYL